MGKSRYTKALKLMLCKFLAIRIKQLVLSTLIFSLGVKTGYSHHGSSKSKKYNKFKSNKSHKKSRLILDLAHNKWKFKEILNNNNSNSNNIEEEEEEEAAVLMRE